MKCIHCSYDSKYKDRSSGKCPSCNRAFAFEPKSGARYTDMAFKSAIDRVSSNGSVRFLPAHVRYELVRRKRRTRVGSYFLWAISGLGLVLGSIVSPAFLLLSGITAIVGWASWPKAMLPARVDSQFETEWQRWCLVHGTPKGLIVRRLPAAPSANQPPPDLSHYSFDRAVICDRDETVDVLLANNFHFENNCAVLSVNGYPARSFETVKAMLKKNPRLTVYVLHDATQDGCRLAGQLASDPNWFRGQARVVEIGLRPAHAEAFPGLWAPGSIDERPGVSKAEQQWLNRYSLELFAVRPEQVIKRLFQAISAGESELVSASGFVFIAGGGEYYVDKRSFAREATSSDGGGDSFG